LRYFNVFGKRQDPHGAYAAVIPKWLSLFLKKECPIIYGDGETSRDFCYIDNAVQANILAAACTRDGSLNKVYNIAYGERTTLNQLFQTIRQNLVYYDTKIREVDPKYALPRAGDVRHSLADISRARDILGYEPQFDLNKGMKELVSWHLRRSIEEKDAFSKETHSDSIP
jgi:UDP-N-acetylglucosamine 4-epimerase